MSKFDQSKLTISNEEWILFNDVIAKLPTRPYIHFLLTKIQREAIDKILRLNPYYNTKRERMDALYSYIKEKKKSGDTQT